MAHFQLIPRSENKRAHSDFTKWGNILTAIEDDSTHSPPRILLKGSAIDENNEKIFLHKGRQITLQQSGNTGGSGEMPIIESAPSNNVVSVTNVVKAGNKQTFNLAAKQPGQIKLIGKKPGSSINSVAPLTVIVGEFKYHTGMKYDLLAEVLGKSDDAYKLYYLQRLLNNNEDGSNLFNQRSDFYMNKYGKKFHKELVCESVCIISGEVLFERVHSGRTDLKWSNLGPHHRLYTLLNKPPKSKEDVQYVAGRVDKARQAIANSLFHNIPVVARCAYDPVKAYNASKNKIDSGKSGGHCLLIVGCNQSQDRFLYIDPFPGLSYSRYAGGIVPIATPCRFLGLLKIENSASRGPVFQQDRSYQPLEVLECPLRPIS